MESAKAAVRTAKGDVEQQIAAHWAKMMKLVKGAGPALMEVDSPNQGTDLNRLAGI